MKRVKCPCCDTCFDLSDTEQHNSFDYIVGTSKIKLVELKQTCLRFPQQWSGKTEDGREFYARERWDYMFIELDGVRYWEDDGTDLWGAITAMFTFDDSVVE